MKLYDMVDEYIPWYIIQRSAGGGTHFAQFWQHSQSPCCRTQSTMVSNRNLQWIYRYHDLDRTHSTTQQNTVTIQTYTSNAFPPEKHVWIDLIAGVWAPFSNEQIENRGDGWWNRWNTIQNRESPDSGPLGKMRNPTKNDDRCAFGTFQTIETFTIPNYEEEECQMKHTHAHVTTTISSSIPRMVFGGPCRRGMVDAQFSFIHWTAPCV
jgi:hypothetical protein